MGSFKSEKAMYKAYGTTGILEFLGIKLKKPRRPRKAHKGHATKRGRAHKGHRRKGR
jgi:hypothetical protein